MSELERAAIAWRKGRLAFRTGEPGSDERRQLAWDSGVLERELEVAADRALAAGPGEPSLGELESVVVEAAVAHRLARRESYVAYLDARIKNTDRLADRYLKTEADEHRAVDALLAARAAADRVLAADEVTG